jgi:hypothetical protein
MKLTVEIVKSRPDLPNLVPVYGITSKAGAEAWGWKNGMSLVYWIRGSQKAYGVLTPPEK